jgi:AcrR family transcriptional regulator
VSGHPTTPGSPARASGDLRRAQGAASRERLLEAATALFAERGVAATGVDAVARRAGVVKSALYWHFGSKQGLVAAVVGRVGETWLREIRASVEQEGGFDARLDRFVEGVRGLVEERPELLRLFLAVAVERSEVEPGSRDAVWSVLARSRDAIVEVLRDTLGFELPDAEAIAHLALEITIGIAVEATLAPPGTALAPRLARLRSAMAREIRSQMRRAGRPPEDPGGTGRAGD